MTGGVSPCRTGGYTMEGNITGLLPREVQNIANILGENVFSEDLGVLLNSMTKRWKCQDILIRAHFC